VKLLTTCVTASFVAFFFWQSGALIPVDEWESGKQSKSGFYN
jgi:hypothetical protein